MKKIKIPVSKQGLHKHKGVVKVPSNNITMEGIDFPVIGIGDNGETKLMMPQQNYLFEGASSVLEIPTNILQQGGVVQPIQMSNEPKNYQQVKDAINEKNKARMALANYNKTLASLGKDRELVGGSKSREREREKQDGGYISILPEDVQQAIITPNGRYIQLVASDSKNKPRSGTTKKDVSSDKKLIINKEDGVRKTQSDTTNMNNINNMVNTPEQLMFFVNQQNSNNEKDENVKKNPYLFPIQKELDISQMSNNSSVKFRDIVEMSFNPLLEDEGQELVPIIEAIVKQNRNLSDKGRNKPVTADEIRYFIKRNAKKQGVNIGSKIYPDTIKDFINSYNKK